MCKVFHNGVAWVAEMSDNLNPSFVLQESALRERIKNLSALNINTDKECAALAEMLRLQGRKV